MKKVTGFSLNRLVLLLQGGTEELENTIGLQYKLMLVQRRSRSFFPVDVEETEVATSFELLTQIKLMY